MRNPISDKARKEVAADQRLAEAKEAADQQLRNAGAPEVPAQAVSLYPTDQLDTLTGVTQTDYCQTDPLCDQTRSSRGEAREIASGS